MNNMIQYNLYQCRTQQPFRVATGKTRWHWYNPDMYLQESWNLREILSNEIVIEFDTDNRAEALEAINFTALNLCEAGFAFEIWDHKGRSPHLHIRNLPFPTLEKTQLKHLKHLFIEKYVPEEFLACVDFSLCGIHLVALEGVNHWKGKYDVKRLRSKFEGNELMISNKKEVL